MNCGDRKARKASRRRTPSTDAWRSKRLPSGSRFLHPRCWHQTFTISGRASPLTPDVVTAFKPQQRHVTIRGRPFHFVSFEGRRANRRRAQLAYPAMWYLMVDGRRCPVLPCDASLSPPELDAALRDWAEDNALGPVGGSYPRGTAQFPAAECEWQIPLGSDQIATKATLQVSYVVAGRTGDDPLVVQQRKTDLEKGFDGDPINGRGDVAKYTDGVLNMS